MTRTQPPRAVKKPQNFAYSAPATKIKREASEGPKASTSRKVHKGNKVTKPKAATAKVRKAKPIKAKAIKAKIVLNHPPTEVADVFVCGTNEQGGLGLGAGSKPGPVYRPRLNPILSSAGVVQIAAGGMHCIALTSDNKLLSWGVNDLGALGRDTTWEAAWIEPNADKSDDESDDEASGINPKESTPTEIDASLFPDGTIFAQVAAGDNASFALTDDGLLYGWGTYKSIDGDSTFSSSTSIQKLPTLIPTPSKIIKVAAGSNHALALTSTGAVLAWGMGEKHQLGRRINERSKTNALLPQPVGLKKNIVNIGAGADHSFAIHSDGTVFAWGLNNYCQTGIPTRAGEDFLNILHPTPIPSLRAHAPLTHIAGGNHHSIATTATGACLTWGRLNNFATGLDADALPADDVVFDARGRPGILQAATQVPGIDAVFGAAGSDHCFAVGRGGRVWSWGFNAQGQAGQGGDEEEVEGARVVENTAVRGRVVVWAGAGGQYGVLMGRKEGGS